MVAADDPSNSDSQIAYALLADFPALGLPYLRVGIIESQLEIIEFVDV